MPATVSQEKVVENTSAVNVLKVDQSWAFGQVTLAEFFSDVFDVRGYAKKTFYFQNTTDRIITLVCEASNALAMTEPYVLKTITIAPGNVEVQRVVARQNEDFDPYLRWRISADANATVGALAMKGRFKEW